MKHRLVHLFVGLLWAALIAGGCAHYPANPFLKKYSPDTGYRLSSMSQAERSDQLLLFLAFSGGGTRAASLAYGVLEELAQNEIFLEGRRRTLLDEVDIISSVSGGSFTAAYYGLFGRRIFEDFESRFLKKNVQKELFGQALDIGNSFRLLSAKFGRSDLAAEYYDRNVFEGGTFGDIMKRGGPLVLINATDLTLGNYFTFAQEMFDLICSDLSRMPVARAVAASSAVPVILTPITLYNYAGSCDYVAPDWINRVLEEPSLSRRRYQQACHLKSYMDVQKRPYIHLIDGGMSDNLGLRAAIDRLTVAGDVWRSLQYLGLGNTRRVVFILANAEKEVETPSDYMERTPSSGWVMKSVTNIPIARYNFETVELLRQNFKKWEEEIRSQRCPTDPKRSESGTADSEPDSCTDIKFYLVEVDFNSLPDRSERAYLNGLPTSFHLPPGAVDHLRRAARKILNQSPEFQRLLRDIKQDPG